MKSLILAALLLSAAPAGAEPFPAAYRVKGVSANDVLNIRAEPSAASAKVGSIGAFGITIEVLRLSDDGQWGLVGLPEGNGWVAMRFLEATPPANPNELPRPLSCFGTEPFWGLSVFDEGAVWQAPDLPRADLTVTEEAVAWSGFRFRAEEGPTRVFDAVISRQRCGDGMSDREFGLSVSLFIESPDGNAVVTGCCTLDHRDN